jgi:hydroxyacylglutathione hydrolase
MQVKRFINGPFSVNTYLVYDGTSSVVIDPGHDMERLIRFAHDNALHPKAILLTHAHIDHVVGITEIRKAFPGTETYIHEDDIDLLSQAAFQAKMFSLPDPGRILIEKRLVHQEKISFGSITFTCIFTPGHSPGSLCFYVEKENVLFAGDLIFYESVGRTDLFGGNHSDLLRSIKDKILTLPANTIIHPGHGSSTDVAHETEYNPFIN